MMKLLLRRHALLVLFFMTTLLFAQDQTDNPLELRIGLRQEKVCLNEKVEMELILTNKSKRAVVIDLGSLGYETVFTWSEDSEGEQKSGMISSIANVGPDYKPIFLVLNPKQSYKKTSSLILDGTKFKAGVIYNLIISYGQFSDSVFRSIPVFRGTVDSNLVPIMTKNCSQE